MDDLNWLVGRRFQSLALCDFDWVFQFENRIVIVTQCLWRVVENGCICVTKDDHGHRFGLPAPVDAPEWVNSRLAGATVTRVALRAGVLDLSLEFDAGALLEFLPNSCGYDSWDVARPDGRFIACGGGRLQIYGEGSPHVTP